MPEHAPKPLPPIVLRGALGLLLLAVVAAYAGALRGPFVFDDIAAILDNPTIRQVWPLGEVLHPPVGDGLTVGGRPLLNLTFALNFAAGGLDPTGYRAANIALHVLNTLLLFGVVRWTLRLVGRPSGGLADGERVALLVAMGWALHPLQTESVTYIAQRAESLAAFFCLATLYSFVRATEAGRGFAWKSAAVGLCALGMTAKETMAVTPLLILLYDRTFVASTFRGAWFERRGFYTALGATWLILAGLVYEMGNRGGSTAAGDWGTTWHYLLTQCGAIWHYLRLVVWPQPLVFDYGVALVTDWREVAGAGLALLTALGATVWALVRRPAAGFVPAAFFLWLAPSSSFIPVTSQTMAEHRMYLPLALVLVPVALGLVRWLPRSALWLAAGLALLGGGATWQRNQIYRSEIALWQQTLAARPDNARAHDNLAHALLEAGQIDTAGEAFATAIELRRGDFADALNGLGLVRLRQGRASEAVAALEDASRRKPDNAAILANLGGALARTGRLPEALAVYERAAARGRMSPDLCYNWGNALIAAGRLPEATAQFQHAVALRPDFADARVNLGIALTRQSRAAEACAEFEAVLQTHPDDVGARVEYANALLADQKLEAAIAQLELAAEQQPTIVALPLQLGHLLFASGHAEAAAARYRQALRLEPSAEAHHGLAQALAALGQRPAAMAEDEAALRLEPDFAPARRHLEALRRDPP